MDKEEVNHGFDKEEVNHGFDKEEVNHRFDKEEVNHGFDKILKFNNRKFNESLLNKQNQFFTTF